MQEMHSDSDRGCIVRDCCDRAMTNKIAIYSPAFSNFVWITDKSTYKMAHFTFRYLVKLYGKERYCNTLEEGSGQATYSEIM